MHLKLTWYGETYILSATKNVAIKKLFFSTKRINNYSPNLRPCSITEVWLHVELKQLMQERKKRRTVASLSLLPIYGRR